MSQKDDALAQEQRQLIREYQEQGLDEDRLSYLIKSFHGIAKMLGEKWQTSFPQCSVDEIAAEGDYATFLALKKFDCDRDIRPSTFFYCVMRTHIAKKWWHDRTKCVRMDTGQTDEETGRPLKLHLPHVSLNSYVDEHGDINELGRLSYDFFNETVQQDEQLECLEELCSNDLIVHRVMMQMIKVTTVCTRRTRSSEVIRRVAHDLSVSVEDVERVIQTVKNRVKNQSLSTCLSHLKKHLLKTTVYDITDMVLMSRSPDVTELMRWSGQL